MRVLGCNGDSTKPRRQIEPLGPLRKRMNHDGEHAGIAGDMDGPEQGVTQQGAAKALAVMAAVDGQAAEHQHRQRIGHIAPHRLGRRLVADPAGRQGVIADGGAAVANDKAA